MRTLEAIARLRNLQTAIHKLESMPSGGTRWLDRLLKLGQLYRQSAQLESRLVRSVASMSAIEKEALIAVFMDGCRSNNGEKCRCGSCQRRRQIGE